MATTPTTESRMPRPSRELKASAIARLESGEDVQSVSDDIGVGIGTLNRWLDHALDPPNNEPDNEPTVIEGFVTFTRPSGSTITVKNTDANLELARTMGWKS